MKRLLIILVLMTGLGTSFSRNPFVNCSRLPCLPPPIFPHDTRSDTIDILNYSIHLSITNFTTKVITGFTEVRFSPLVNNVSHITLDLLALQVDSVTRNGLPLSYAQAGDSVRIVFSPLNDPDTADIRIYYHGVPATDTYFGGFYFQNGFAYNVGVSLDDIPHNYGKTWFPCFDNFTDRATYDLAITTKDIHKAVCGGTLVGIVQAPNNELVHTWRINQTIPTYLVSVAINNLQYLYDNYQSISGDTIPVWIATRPQDSTNVRNSFANLEDAFHIYEAKFGPYQWDRVGYSIVPMSAGAMEHAMNIAYPITLANGSLAYQDVMAHELSHHWWGDLVTCRTAEDMWINEGSAAYCEYIFNEFKYGAANYRSLVRNAHKTLLHKAHIDDDGYWPLSGVPQNHTYGVTTYTKGADIIHTLRSYLGDSLFFSGLTQLLQQNAFSDIDAAEYRDDLAAIIGVNLDNFFDDWIFQGGWPHFSIDSTQVSGGPGNYTISVHLKQKLIGRSSYAHGVPFTLTLRNAGWERIERHITVGGATDVVTVNSPFLPAFTGLNLDEKISHAVTAEYRVISGTGSVSLPHANFSMNVSQVNDSMFFLVEHNWAHADAMIDQSQGIAVSTQRYWKIDGVWTSGFQATATFAYNGRTTGNGYLDNELITGGEDSLILMYRPGPGFDWTEDPDYTKSTGASVTDKVGTITVNQLRKGEYCFGYRGGLTGILLEKTNWLKIYPNPTKDHWRVDLDRTGLLQPVAKLFDAQGRLIRQESVNSDSLVVSAESLPSGIYFLTIVDAGRILATRQIIKSK